jgi:RNA polymerase sigma-70 factor (ECF subfamily)
VNTLKAPLFDELSDDELVRAAQDGSLDAFNMLFERYLPVVTRRVRCVAPAEEVQDITQEVFIAVIRSLKNFRFEARFSTWLRTLVNRQVADYYRNRARKVQAYSIDGLVDDPGGDGLFGEDNSDRRDEVIAIRQALMKIPENYREIIVLRFVEGLQFDEIAVLHGQSLDAAKSLFRRAMKALTQQIISGEGHG